MSIKVKNLTYTYSKNTPFEKIALNNINLEIKSGELWLFVGHTGSGKSTLINTFNGLLIPQQGEVYIDEESTKSKEIKIKDIRRKVGIIFQYPETQFFLPTIKEEILYAPKNFNVNIDKKEISFYMQLLSLPYEYLERSPFNLSGGEMRKVAIISVLSYKPEYIIFDEPTVGLDYSTRESVFNTIKQLNKMGKTIILSTHWISEFLELKPNVLMLKDSKEAFIGSFDEFITLDYNVLEDSGIILDEKLDLYRKTIIHKKENIKNKILNI
ncbi:MAG: energy-coupling factor transport system ATP-binding protein [Oceanotoga sp.]|uniref:ATP-binding cassette domain-containing protein n=1 Tax=Oceanotoga sp. TaxID=2108366 RepID=UPI0026535A28|nr:ATP-binding cassette domain-containing protein [Oceanotoga sp.]MDN5341222.1 energy-coupling factor transport system ATP-binding protein [Oceanotoga sp.]